MDRITEERLRSSIAEIVKERKSSLAADVRFVPAGDYTDPARRAKERKVLFRKFPLVVTLSSRIPNTNDFVTENVAGISVIVVRDASGAARAFVNACRHRANVVCTEASGNTPRFTCGYHAWTYGTDGSCRFSDQRAFAGASG